MKLLKEVEAKPNTIVYERNNKFYTDNIKNSVQYTIIKPFGESVFFTECKDDVDYFIDFIEEEYKIYYNKRGERIYLNKVFKNYHAADEYLGELDNNCRIFAHQMWWVRDSNGREYRKNIIAYVNRFNYVYKNQFKKLNWELDLTDSVTEFNKSNRNGN